MKTFILIAATFFIINIYALPQCPSDTAARWHNCFGTYTYANGDKYVGEWKDNNQHGQGTYTFANGETKTGVWENNSYLETKAELDAKRKAKEEAKQKYERIYNACLLDKSSDVDMQVSALRIAVEETCEAIAEEPSWYENWKYN